MRPFNDTTQSRMYMQIQHAKLRQWMLSDVNHLFPTVVSVPPAGHIQASHDLFAHLSGRGFSLFDPMLAWRFSSVGAQHDIKKLSAETGLTEIGVQDWISVIRMHAHGLRSDWIPLVAPLGRVRRQARPNALSHPNPRGISSIYRLLDSTTTLPFSQPISPVRRTSRQGPPALPSMCA